MTVLPYKKRFTFIVVRTVYQPPRYEYSHITDGHWTTDISEVKGGYLGLMMREIPEPEIRYTIDAVSKTAALEEITALFEKYTAEGDVCLLDTHKLVCVNIEQVSNSHNIREVDGFCPV